MVLRAGSSPGPYTQYEIRVPSEKAAVCWRCFPGRSALLPMRRALSPRKPERFSFMLPYSREMMIVDISLDCVGSHRPLWGTLLRVQRLLTLMFPYSRGVMIVLRRSLYGVASDGRVLGLSFGCRQQFCQDFPREQTFRWKRVLAELCFSVLGSSCFIHGTKTP